MKYLIEYLGWGESEFIELPSTCWTDVPKDLSNVISDKYGKDIHKFNEFTFKVYEVNDVREVDFTVEMNKIKDAQKEAKALKDLELKKEEFRKLGEELGYFGVDGACTKK